MVEWSWNVQKDAAHFSKAWKRSLGYFPSEIGKNPYEWFGRVHPQDRSRLGFVLRDFDEGKTQDLAIPLRMQCKDGGYKNFQYQLCAKKRNALGNILTMTGNFKEIQTNLITEIEGGEVKNLKRILLELKSYKKAL